MAGKYGQFKEKKTHIVDIILPTTLDKMIIGYFLIY